MARITIFLLILMGYTSAGYGQCIRTVLYPTDTFTSDNSGFVQTINTCVWTENNYSVVDGLITGSSYVFTCRQGDVQKYVTVTDLTNQVIAEGYSPLTVDVTTTSVRLHYSENELCVGSTNCSTATVQVVLPCPFPLDVAISNITTSNATFTWEPAGDETAWQVLVLAQGAPAPTAQMMGAPVTGESEYTHTSLVPALQYNFYVRSNCGEELSPWSAPFSFSSGCNPITELQEGFEGLTTPALPICWTGLLVDAPFASIESVWNSNSGSLAAQLSNGEATSASKVILISPAMSTVNTGTHRVKFYAKSFSSAPLEVGTMSATTADGVFTSLGSFTVGDIYQEYTVDFTEYDGTDVHFAFRHPSPQMFNPVFIDDIRWEVAPPCADVTNIAIASASTTSATVTWTGGNELEWDVVFSTDENANPTTLIPISPAPEGEPEAEITGLNANTVYYVWVRSSCGETIGDGAWIGPASFKTPCPPISDFSENFNTAPFGELPACWSAIIEGPTVSNSAFVAVTSDGTNESRGAELSNYSSGPTDEIILVSPNLSTLTTGTHRLKFYGRSGASIEVGTLSSPVGANNFTMYETIQLTSTYAEYVVDFSEYSGTDTYVGIRHIGAPFFRILIDDIRWELSPACPDVTAVAVSEVTANTALLTWDFQGSETQWDVVVGGENETNPSSLPLITPSPTGTPELLLNGLIDNTFYNVWVRSACGGTEGNGAWIGPVSFRTSCVPTATVSEGFETTEYGDVPLCWTGLTFGPTIPEYAAVRTVTFGGFNSTNSLELWPADMGADDFVMLVSPALTTVATATHRLKVRAFTYSQATMAIGTINGTNSDAVFTPLTQVVVTPSYSEYVINFDSYEGTDTYFALRNLTTGVSLFIDDLRWEVVPACPDVVGIASSNLTTEGATISWTPEGSEAGFQVAYGAADVTDPTTLTPSAVQTDNEFTITGLADNYNFNVWVRSVCSAQDGNGMWMGPLSLTTLCLPAAVPYTQDFESANTPDLPGCSVMENLGFGNDWITRDNPGFGFANKTLVYVYNNQNNADVWYYTRGIALTADNEYSISYKYGNNSDTSYSEKMKVAYGLSPDEQNMTETLADHDQINTGAPLTNTVTFTPLASGVYYFGFHAYSNQNQYDLYLDDIVVDTALSTPSAPVTNFSYYPNPVKDKLYLSASDIISDVAVYNLLGQVVQQQSASQKEVAVDMSALAAGSYIVKLTAGSASRTIKVIKN